ncbi:hypothetical protein RHSIM_Rhsim11G0102200 [Rhododendron simsii]|uniref:Pentatricopeptide repeat-containing protein n=1 Tax=Rhododendron simsii TaxID=118357 RepID=A0A834G9H1_RHOSS|nr:hypothetical protein RHSIM_Rhsim11G0102200 [Rhododendron simsii]
MAVKLSSLTYSKKIPNWVYLRAYVSSVSCANKVQIFPENDQNLPNTSEFEEKIQFLRNQLHPASLIRVLDATHDLSSSLKLFKWVSLQKRFRHTAKTYYKMILKLGMAGNVEEMEGFCNEIVRERCPGTEEAFAALIDSFVRHGRLNEASRVLVAMNLGGYKPTIGLFNVLLGALVGEKRDFQDVLFVYKEMVKAGIVPTTETLNYLIEALFDNDQIGTALDQYRRMYKKGCSPNSRTFEILISGLAVRNLVDESIVVLDEVVGLKFEPSLSFYSRIVPIFCWLNNLELVMRLFKMMKASNISPDSQLYEVLIQCLCNNHRLNDAINLVEEMKAIDLTPSDDILADIVNCFCKLGKADEATKFLENKHAVGSHPHNVLLGGYCSAGNLFAAEVLLFDMLQRNIADTVSWNVLIRWVSENVGINNALEFLSRMIVSSYVPDYATYSAIVVGKCRLSKYKDALELFHQIRAKSWVLDSTSYGELVECLCQSQMIQEADEVFCYMSDKKCTLQFSSFTTLIKGLCVTGNVRRAISLLSLPYCSGTSCSAATYNAIMLGLSKLGKEDDLMVVLSRMLVEGHAPDGETYGLLIESMIALGRIDDCVLFFNLMASQGLSPDSEMLTYLLSRLAKRSQLHMILLALDKLIINHALLNSAMCNVLTNGLWKEGYKSEACRILDMMLEKGWVPDASTHGLLMRSVVREEGDCKLDNDNPDKISNILADGLGKT